MREREIPRMKKAARTADKAPADASSCTQQQEIPAPQEVTRRHSKSERNFFAPNQSLDNVSTGDESDELDHDVCTQRIIIKVALDVVGRESATAGYEIEIALDVEFPPLKDRKRISCGQLANSNRAKGRKNKNYKVRGEIRRS